ncbi:hypothetical protein FACS1894182_02950 [Bacteroidia bacterium]|nr:hypothetical protein FACS1894182_02950 [Bacteroidia bacterium]
MKRRTRIAFYVLSAVFGLSISLSSCVRNNEIPEGEGSGVLIPLSVKVLGIQEGGSEEITRSGSVKEFPERLVTPLGDGMLLEMSVESDSPQLRAGTTQALEAGTAFRVIAVKSSDKTYVSHGDFTVDGATTVSTFHVPEGGTYDFICFSYHSALLPDAAGYAVGSVLPTLAVTSNDLLLDNVSVVSRTVNQASDAALTFVAAAIDAGEIDSGLFL